MQALPPPQSISGPVRSNRKQNSSCDTCKSRKVKCDLSGLPPGSVCANCSLRSIPCTQETNTTRKACRVPRYTAASARAQAPLATPPHAQLQPSTSHFSQQPSQHHDQRLVAYPSSGAPIVFPSNALASGSSTSFPSPSSFPSSLTSLPYPNPPYLATNLAPTQQSSTSSLFFHPTTRPVLSVPSINSSESRLVDSTLSQSLERSLVDQFFLSAHTYIQPIHPLEFKVEYKAAYHLSSLLPPASQCLVALMAAHGARLSNSHHHAKFTSDARSKRDKGGTEAMSQALAKRGLDILESHRLMTRPSKRAIQALFLARSLLLNLSMSSEEHSDEDRLHFSSRIRLFSSALHDHIYSLGLWDEAERLNTEYALSGRPPTELPDSRILWIAYTCDSFETMSDRQRPRPFRVTNDRFFSAFRYAPRVDRLPSLSGISPDYCFLLLMAAYPMFGELARTAVDTITAPAANQSKLQPIAALVTACETLWAKYDAYVDWFDRVASQAMKAQSSDVSVNLGGQSPLLFFIRVIMSGPGFWMHIHSIIRKRLAAERRELDHFPPSSSPESNGSPSNDSLVFDPFASSSRSSIPPSIAILQELELTGLERAMTSCRMVAHRVKKIVECRPDLIGIEFTPDFQYYLVSQFLARIPTVEQGFRGKMPSFDHSWTWKTKCEEIDWLLHAMEIMSGPNAVSQRIVRITKLLHETLPRNFPPFLHTPFHLARSAYAQPYPSTSRPSYVEAEAEKFVKIITRSPATSVLPDPQTSEVAYTSISPRHPSVSHSTIPPSTPFDLSADPFAFLYDDPSSTDPPPPTNALFSLNDQAELALDSVQHPTAEETLDFGWTQRPDQDSLGDQRTSPYGWDSRNVAGLEAREGAPYLDPFYQCFETSAAVF